MFHRTQSLFVWTVGIAIFCAATSAAAQSPSHRPDADVFPCRGQGRSTVVQDAQGFSIMDGAAQMPPRPADAGVPLGARLTLDRALFARVASMKEASDAPRR